MKRGNRRICNLKTKAETGFDFAVSKLNISTPLGKSLLKEEKTFYPGDEELLNEELGKVEAIKNLIEKNPKSIDEIKEIFHCMKDIRGSIERASKDTLSLIELFEIKSLLLYMEKLKGILEGLTSELMPEEFLQEDSRAALDILDPRGDRINTFYIYDDYSQELKGYREEKKNLDKEIRRLQKRERDKIKEIHGISLTPKFDIVIPKSSDRLEAAKGIKELRQIAEDYNSITFALGLLEEAEELTVKKEELNLKIEEEEFNVRKDLSKRIGEHSELILGNCLRIARLDYVLSKAQLAESYNLVRPIIRNDHVIEIEEGRNIQVESILKSKGKEYTPITLNLKRGVTCITGANMGGKTVSLKMAGLIPLMAQHGYFVPCEKAEIGLSNYIRILVGDSQSVERGLSSFGSEMEELKEMLDQGDDRSLMLIDELAGGTNPKEGLALTKSIVDYLKEQPYITLLTTHYERVTSDENIRNMQVKGLGDVDFRKLNSELSLANRRERIDIIGKYMDYRLIPVERGKEVPKDAINIAKMLGIPSDIIDRATEYMEVEEDKE